MRTSPRLVTCVRHVVALAIITLIGCATSEALRAQVPSSGARVEADTVPVTVTVRVSGEDRPLESALVRSGTGRTAVGARTDARGVATLQLGAGRRWLVASSAGYQTDSVALTLRAGADTTASIELRASSEAAEGAEKGEQAASLSAVVVTATRSQRRVEAEPTRVDVLGEEEIQEKTSMTPGSSAMLLSETGGVHVAATSAGLGGANVRVQGLRGRYTQLLSDGLPLYGLSTEGLGLLQIPPIDLRQVELIKGAASALYGPGALGGVINFASRRPPVFLPGRPRESRELYVNQTSLGGSDVALFDARALSSRWGYTLLATGNRQGKRDLNDDGWADVAGYERGTVRPRLYWTGADGSDLFLTTGITAENRRGGGMAPSGALTTPAFNGGSFAESRDTRRADGGAVAHVPLGGGRVLALRGSATSEWRRASYGAAPEVERDRRSTLFAEAALTLPAGTAQELVLGAAVQRDGYTPRDVPALAYAFTAPAIFAQHTWTPVAWFGLTSSARLDAHSEYGTTLSPRVSALVRPWSDGPLAGWTARVSGGIGTYAPTPFVEEIEEIGLRRLRPITGSASRGGLRAERARSGSADVGGVLGRMELNAAVYASLIDHAVGLRGVDGPAAGDSVELVNATLPTRTRGAQLFARYRAGELSVTGSYDYQRATEQDVESDVPDRRRGVPLTPRHAAGATASWESETGRGVALEGFYTGRQPLADDPYRTESPPYVMFGALLRMRVGKAVVYINGENLGNVRQTHYDPLLLQTPGLGGRQTTDVWAPLDGAVVNAGVRVGF